MDVVPSAGKLEAAFDQFDTAVMGLDLHGTVTYCNKALADVLGLSTDEVMGEDWCGKFLPERERSATQEQLYRLRAGDDVQWQMVPLLGPDGQNQMVEWHHGVVRNTTGEVTGTLSFGCVVRASRGREALFRLRQDLVELKDALDRVSIVTVTDVKGRILYANDTFCKTCGYTREELIGQDHRLLNSGYHPKEFIQEMWQTIGRGKVWRGVVRNKAKSGKLYWVDTVIVPLLNDRGKPYKYLAIRNNITKRIMAERRRSIEAQAAQVEEVAAIVDRDLRTPLKRLEHALDILGRHIPVNSEDREVLADAHKDLSSLLTAAENLASFSHDRDEEYTETSLIRVLRDAAAEAGSHPDLEQVDISVSAEPVRITVCRPSLTKAFAHLIINAGQAMKGQGQVRIRAAVDGPNCRVGVSDQGPGIPSDIRDLVFRPFYTTVPGRAGLGLASAKRVLELHGGHLEVLSGITGGTEVVVHLPLKMT